MARLRVYVVPMGLLEIRPRNAFGDFIDDCRLELPNGAVRGITRAQAARILWQSRRG